ncbi:hypothetical protein LXD69_00745 [Flavobacterium sediminilitoris]|uniref:Uncharacterized protein n=1 Tax=Flavobacterium sediminilitoris TaxID=2024526 RepID=A0ABY4HMY9_9FLAO|nr:MULTISPECIES: hypothetical protein [Flavobacterium]UOX34053.1 hypothetical protein LXD69_00745 [Flavobacterium sediminilitoris]
MRNTLAYLVMIVPIVTYNIYYYNETTRGIDLWQVLGAFIIGAISYKIGMDIKNRGKVK